MLHYSCDNFWRRTGGIIICQRSRLIGNAKLSPHRILLVNIKISSSHLSTRSVFFPTQHYLCLAEELLKLLLGLPLLILWLINQLVLEEKYYELFSWLNTCYWWDSPIYWKTQMPNCHFLHRQTYQSTQESRECILKNKKKEQKPTRNWPYPPKTQISFVAGVGGGVKWRASPGNATQSVPVTKNEQQSL